jgi:hypothetical protein
MIKKIKSSLLSVLLLSSTLSVEAKQSVNSNPWGYTGLINMPTADTLNFGEYNVTGNYLFRNPGFLLNAHLGIFDRLELGIVGGIPSAGFSGLAGNLKYQLIKPSVKTPTSLAIGLNLIGLARDTRLTTGNSLYMVLSQDFNWQMPDQSIYNLFSGHVGFSGNLDTSRIMVGLDVPVTEYVNLEGEYLGKTAAFDEMINFGIKAKPLPYLGVSFLTLGTSVSKGFTNTEYLLSVSYNGHIPFMQQISEKKEDKVVEKIAVQPTPEPTKIPTPVKTVEPQEEMPKSEPTVLPTPKSLPKPSLSPTPEPIVVATPISTPIPSPSQIEVAVTPKSTPKPVKPTPEPEVKTKFGTIKGEIKGSIGGIKPLEVDIILKDSKSSFQKQNKSDSNGNYTFNDIPKGEYVVSFQKNGFTQVNKQIFVNNGDTTEVNIEMSASNGSISGRILDKNGNSLEGISIALDKGKKALTEKNGKFIFNDIPAGYHLLSVYSDGKEVKSFDLDIIAGTELTKELIVDVNVKKTKKQVVITKTEPVKKPISEPVKTSEPVEPTKVTSEPVKPIVKIDNEPIKKGTAGITGKITDKNGVLKGSRVMFEGDKLTVMTISGEDGVYTVKNIAIGTYKMTISKSGYISRVFSVKIKEAKQANHDVKLVME